jgi:ABC-type lipoprotein release transport system permease subunit
MLFKIAFRNLWRNRSRTIITASVIAIAVLIAIFTRSLNEGTYAVMIDNVVGMYTGYVQVHQKGFWDDQSMDNAFAPSEALVESLNQHGDIRAWAPRLEGFALASSGNISKGAAVLGIDPVLEDSLTGLKGLLVRGKYLDEGRGGAMLSEGLAERLRIGLGDSVVLIGQGYHGITAAGIYPIVGLLHFGSPQLNDRMCYIDIETAQEFFAAPNMLTAIAANMEVGQNATALATSLRSEVDTAQYEVMDWGELMPELVQTIEGDRAGGIIFMYVLYLIISFIIFGTVLMMIEERKFEFGVINAVGMSRWNLVGMMILELLMLTLIGVLTGFVLAFPLVLYFSKNPIYLGDQLAEAYAEFAMGCCAANGR